ncbi:MAG TPA: RHS repeat-associated core domain-containing protein [Ktedonobacterales bacterium]|nr:RHS repeat-associated core domain-containing protein [Ktedonobacterales bacterium]
MATVNAYGNVAASYAYDAFGQVTSASENFGGTTTWTNPYRSDGRDGVRYDGETGLYWMSVRAYDPALGRFLSRDPLGRIPLFFSDQPYVYGGNNPLVNVDPSGQRIVCDFGNCVGRAPTPPSPPKPTGGSGGGCHSDGSCGCYSNCGGGGKGGGGGSGNGKACPGSCTPQQAAPANTGCTRTCLQSIYSGLNDLYAAIAPFAVLSNWPTYLAGLGGVGSIAVGVLKGMGRLKGLPFIGAGAGAFLSTAVGVLWFMGDAVQAILNDITSMKQDINNAEINGDTWDPTIYSSFKQEELDRINHLQLAYAVGIGVGAILTLVLAVSSNPFAPIAAWASAGLAVGSLAAIVVGYHIKDELGVFYNTVEAAGGLSA